MHDLEKTIRHFESLQKRYTAQHNGQMCERVADALDALQLYNRLTHDFGEIIYKEVLDTFTKMIAGELAEVKSLNDIAGERRAFLDQGTTDGSKELSWEPFIQRFSQQPLTIKIKDLVDNGQ